MKSPPERASRFAVLFGFLLGAFRYYASSERIVQPSPFSLEVAKSRLLAIDDTDVVVKIMPSGLVLMAAVDPNFAMQPLLHGRLREHEGQVVLRGKLGVNPRTRLMVAAMVVAFLVAMLKPLPQRFPGALLVAVLLLSAILSAAYGHHRRNIGLIKKRLIEAISPEET